jgi:hypothetical protein
LTAFQVMPLKVVGLGDSTYRVFARATSTSAKARVPGLIWNTSRLSSERFSASG